MSDVEHLPTVNETVEDNTPTPQPETSIPAIDSLAENDAVITADTPTQPAEIFPLVGIGASAGGLAAFEAFFSGMPPDVDPNMAFVLVQHLAPDHKSLLSELIRRYTRMPVFDVEDGMVVKPNCTYIIPPNHDMALLNGALRLLEPTELRGHRLPIDFFFRSLAQDQHERAICVILSGTGSDGTLGARAVNGEGGIVMAQNPEACEYDGMPRSVISTGLVDYVLPPAEMPNQLIACTTHASYKKRLAAIPPDASCEAAYNKIFVILRARTGHDFSQYKQNTIIRRIERRLSVNQIEQLDEYVRYLQQTPVEVDALFHDLLIGVTNFFRDPEAFTELETLVLKLFAEKPSGAHFRVWCPGCSTGEEAYSIAILLQECMETLEKTFEVQVFATDIENRSIEQARTGIYTASIAADVSPERLTRFFSHEPEDSTYSIRKSIRDLIVFSEQDLITDPPFSRLDLISCRNLLIYMGKQLQKKIIPLFHYALNPGGILFLGTSETVGEFSDLFTTLNGKYKLYECRESIHRTHRPMPELLSPSKKAKQVTPLIAKGGPGISMTLLRELTEQTLLQHYAATGALINQHGDILYLQGRTGQYIELAPGEAGLNILKMAREGLQRALTTALHKAVTNSEPVQHACLRVKTNGDFTNVCLTILPVPSTPESSIETANLFFILLEDGPALVSELPVVDSVEDTPGSSAAIITALRQELQASEDYFQAANEKLEASNEELRASNEEMQSINEELQSTNEELETSKEELQSINEELITVNTELETKMIALSRINNDMINLMAVTGIGIIFVDHQLNIQRFTPAVTPVINLILSDMGRPIGHIASNLVGYDRLVADVQAVLDDLIPREVEVQTQAGVWYLLSIRPYRTIENVIEGAVITFSDITTVRQAQAKLQDAEAMVRLAAVAHDARDAIIMQDLEGNIRAWNPAAQRMYGWNEATILKMNIQDIVPEDQREEALATVRRLGQSEVLEPYRTQRLTQDGRIVDVWLTATALVDAVGAVYAIGTTEREYGS